MNRLKISACTSSQLAEGCCGKPFDKNSYWASQWQFSDNGAGGTWKAGDDFIQFDIADDLKCGGNVNRTQNGTAIINFHTDNVKTFVIKMKGVAESGIEEFKLYINDVHKVFVQAPDDMSTNCERDTCKMCNVSMESHEVSKPFEGNRTIRIEVDTVDHLYHLDAFYRIEFSIIQADVCKACKCPTTGI